ncbi:MAG: Ku protein [Gemmatimonadota bacterium]
MARGIWKGTLGFGLVNIGIELFSAEEPNSLDLDLLDRRDMARVGYLKINKTTGEKIEQHDIVKGMAVSKDRYVILSDADLKAANPKATQSIEILGFVETGAIDLIYFDRPYFVAPLKGHDRAYALLRDSMMTSGRIGLAQVVIRTRQYMCAVYPYAGALVVHLLRYDDEIRDPGALGVPAIKRGAGSASSKEIGMAHRLIEGMVTDWTPARYTDTYRRDLLKMVKARSRKGAKDSIPAPKVTEAEEPKVLDLVAALERSISGKKAPAGPVGRRSVKARKGLRRRTA